ncbi:MAG: hypothetical protein KBC11_00085 [Candidatus Pacebacteria bacterium]|nr:hypothetical protein [Candidatus Paceibacterota bacterium]
MKNSKYILIALMVIVVILLGLTKDKKDIVKDTPEKIADICYIWNTEAGDSANLKMAFFGEGGSIVSGSFDFTPAEKDSKTGTFEGTAGPVDKEAMSRTAQVLWTASGEGITNTEELYIKFGEGNAYPAFGEMKDNGSGLYVYADPANLSYPIALQQTNCDDSTLD